MEFFDEEHEREVRIYLQDRRRQRIRFFIALLMSIIFALAAFAATFYALSLFGLDLFNNILLELLGGIVFFAVIGIFHLVAKEHMNDDPTEEFSEWQQRRAERLRRKEQGEP